MAVTDFSTTAASNTSISGINIAENCSPAGINNAIRQLMADVRSFYNSTAIISGNVNISGTWEWQDDVGAVFGNDADASISWVSADSALALKIGSTARIEATSAGADVTGDLTVSNDVTVTGETETATFGTTAVAQIDLRAKLTLATKQASTSGTDIDFTGIPAGVKEITIMFNNVSLSGSDHILVQIGDSGGAENTGYSSASGTDTGNVTSAAGFIIQRASAGTDAYGMMTLRLMDAATFLWVSSHGVGSNGGAAYAGGGAKALSAELDRVRITRTGTNTFDDGEINISYR